MVVVLDISDDGVPLSYHCTHGNCKYTAKRRGDLKRHLADIHDEGVVWYSCSQPVCKYATKRKGNLARHLLLIHCTNNRTGRENARTGREHVKIKQQQMRRAGAVSHKEMEPTGDPLGVSVASDSSSYGLSSANRPHGAPAPGYLSSRGRYLHERRMSMMQRDILANGHMPRHRDEGYGRPAYGSRGVFFKGDQRSAVMERAVMDDDIEYQNHRREEYLAKVHWAAMFQDPVMEDRSTGPHHSHPPLVQRLLHERDRERAYWEHMQRGMSGAHAPSDDELLQVRELQGDHHDMELESEHGSTRSSWTRNGLENHDRKMKMMSSGRMVKPTSFRVAQLFSDVKRCIAMRLVQSDMTVGGQSVQSDMTVGGQSVQSDMTVGGRSVQSDMTVGGRSDDNDSDTLTVATSSTALKPPRNAPQIHSHHTY